MKTASLLLSLTGAAAQTPAWVNPGATVATGNMCGLQYHHKPHAEPVDLTNTECSAWSDNSCCTFATADESLHKYDTQQGTSALYGGGLGISGCGRVSTECQTFFIQESCLYECDVNAGRYRHHVGDAACATDGNTWQLAGFPLKQTEVDAFYTACAADLFCFGTVDTCTGTTTDAITEDCAALFAANDFCPTERGCTSDVQINANTAAVDGNRGYWTRASGCNSVATGCQAMDQLYTSGTEMVQELWGDASGVPAFTVVATAQETATNSFSLFGGNAMTDTDMKDAAITQANPNDGVNLDTAPFQAPTCFHIKDCTQEAGPCTIDCDRTTVTTTQEAAYGGAACEADDTAAYAAIIAGGAACAPGDNQCPNAALAPRSSGAAAVLPSMIAAAVIAAAF